MQDVDAALYKWYMTAQESGLCVMSDKDLHRKAEQLSQELDKGLPVSMSWIARWKRRYKVSKSGIGWENVLSGILDEYAKEDIFTADETALFWKATPNDVLSQQGIPCEQRITLLCAASMTGNINFKAPFNAQV